MNDAVALKKLGERVLAKGGELPLALLLEFAVPVARLRELARELGLTPKGGFRLERAPAHVLGPLLAEQRDGARLDAVLRLLLPPATPTAAAADPAAAPGAEAGGPAAAESTGLLALREAELARLRDEVERAREAAARARAREAGSAQRLQQAERRLLEPARELARQQGAPKSERSQRGDKDHAKAVHELESEREALLAANDALRRQLAEHQSRQRELEATVAELDALLPKGKRRKKPQPEPPPPSGDRRFLLPRFLPSFYKSLEGKERRAVERAFQAVLLFCTEGHAYPGLEVKQLGGQDTWSLRASLGLRVYFRPLPDGDIELLELGDREDQNTTLRRLKER